jgi:hypothetical protein
MTSANQERLLTESGEVGKQGVPAGKVVGSTSPWFGESLSVGAVATWCYRRDWMLTTGVGKARSNRQAWSR